MNPPTLPAILADRMASAFAALRDFEAAVADGDRDAAADARADFIATTIELVASDKSSP